MKLSDMKVSTRLWLGFGGVLSLLIVVAALGYWGLSSFMAGVDEMQNTEGVIAEHSARARANIVGMRRYEKDMILSLASRQKVDEYFGKWREEHDSALARLAAVEKVAVHSDDKAALEKLKYNLDAYARILARLHDRLASGAVADISSANASLGEAKEAVHEVEALAKDLAADGVKGMAEMNEALDAEGRKLASTILGASMLALLLGVTAAFLIARGIKKPMDEALDVVTKMAEGDLTISVQAKSKDEFGQLLAAMANMLEKLSHVMVDVQAAADNVASGSQELASSSQQMSQGATEQAASIEEVSSSMEEMTSNIQQNTDNARQTEQLALRSSKDAEEGGFAVQETVRAMKEIAEKISIIEEIARQTNLLALNAAIEAARAGEAGKGFAVVASEVRKLAERSQTAAAQISSLSSVSVEVAERAGAMISKIVPDIQRTAELVQEVAAASIEQSSGASQVNKAIQQLDTVVQQNASASEEMASTAEELSSQAEQLQDSIAFFRIDNHSQVRGGRGIKPATRRPVIAHAAKSKGPVKTLPPTGAKKGVALNLGGPDDTDFENY